MNASTVLVTGGAGFIGSRLVGQIVDSGHQVRVLDNLIRGSRDNLGDLLAGTNCRLIRGSITSHGVVRDAVRGVDTVVHLASTNINRSQAYPVEAVSTGIQGTEVVFDESLSAGVDKIVYASSASVYGDAEPPMDETDCPRPKTPYGIGKLAGEQLLDYHARADGLDYTALRFFNVYGPGQSVDAYYTSVINTFVERILGGRAPKIHGAGDQQMDFVYVDDVVRAIRLAMDTDTEHAVYNVGSGESTSVRELAELLIQIAGRDVEPEFIDRDVLATERRASTERARRELGFEAEVSLRDGLGEVVRSLGLPDGKTVVGRELP